MIVIDLEFSGLNPYECGIISIGAVDIFNPKNQFYEECRIDKEDKVNCSLGKTKFKIKSVEEITGFSEEEMRNPAKPSQKEILQRFFKWTAKCKSQILIGQNPAYDFLFLLGKAKKYKLSFPLSYRTFDLHSIALLKYFQVNKKFLVKNGLSVMGLANISKFCGMTINRKAHNALEDAKIEAECFSRLLYGEGIFEEYERFKLPKYLIKKDKLIKK